MKVVKTITRGDYSGKIVKLFFPSKYGDLYTSEVGRLKDWHPTVETAEECINQIIDWKLDK